LFYLRIGSRTLPDVGAILALQNVFAGREEVVTRLRSYTGYEFRQEEPWLESIKSEKFGGGVDEFLRICFGM
jgi:hypothetical protein